MQLNGVAFDLAQYVHQIACVETDFKAVAAIFAADFFRRCAVFRRGYGQRDLVAFQRHFDGAGFFGGDGGDAVYALRECFGVDAQQLVIARGDDAAVIGEGAVDQLAGQDGPVSC